MWATLLLLGCLGVTLALTSCSREQAVSREDRLKWNQAKLKGDYQSAGRKDPKWDKEAQDCLMQFARLNTAPADEADLLRDLVESLADSAVQAGCDDPMVKYLLCRYTDGALSERQERYRSAANNLEGSGYSPLWKFYANVDAANMLWQRRDTNLWHEVWQYRSRSLDDLNQALQDKTMPLVEAYSAADWLFQTLRLNEQELTNAYNTMEQSLFQQGSKSAVAYLIKADFYLKYAWCGRGNAAASRVTEEQWRKFRERLAESEKALLKAWSLNPHSAPIPTLMISIVEGQGKPRAEMELWFQRAMKLDPENYAACQSKLHFLHPEWYGSAEEMVAFGRECVASTNWGGTVPIILVNAHSSAASALPRGEARDAYWQSPAVWSDIQRAYEKFARLNPDLLQYRYPYAYYAFQCGQWQAFNEQVQLIRQNEGQVRVSYFGGKEAFDKMVAQANAAKPAP